ncbi:capsule biosynthesis protein [Pontibacterium sp. N1Y112]|uniref:Capsule biosynthesis protein n=1 Tax=Pontibacterium sinense TaxID=2781979 RepID=A0A8J7JY72_9GAMM|nr:Wzz/FepE/Etk N-terminal domain-containing protein [Pontibacterium sinense]MBE9396119.1 capsule biosynthesis protein [Pontibacterium sinense]
MIRSTLVRNLASLLWAGWRRRYMIAIPALLMPFIGLAVGVLSPKQYETSTTILFQEASQHNPFLEDLSIATNLKARMDALTALLHSRHVLAGVAWKMELINDDMDEKDKLTIISELSRSLKARLVGDNLIQITYRAPERGRMVETLSMISMRFVERVLAPQRSSILQSENFLAKELKQRSTDLLAAETALAEYKNRHASELPTLHSANVSRLAELQSVLAERRIELDGAKAAQYSLAIRLSQTDPVIGKIEESIVTVMAELTELRARYTDQHSSVQNVLARLQALERERSRVLQNMQSIDHTNLDREQLERLWAIATSSRQTSEQSTNSHPLLISQLERLQQADDHIERLTKEVSSFAKEIEKLQQRVNGYGQHERRLNELKRDIQVRQKIYQDLSERHELARVTGSLGKTEESERVKLIDPPYEPLAPINLPLFVFVIAGCLAGLGLGLGLACINELLDTSIRRKDTLKQILNVPVLARIPSHPSLHTGDTSS